MNNTNSDFKGFLKQIEDMFDLYLLKKAPALPENIKTLIVQILPWFIIIGLIFLLPIALAALGLGAFFVPLSLFFSPRDGGNYIISMVFVIAIMVLEALALPGLFKRTRQGWNYLFYAGLVSAVENIVALNIVGLIIGLLIGMYFLFQIREYYK
jgi:hypothetical protein